MMDLRAAYPARLRIACALVAVAIVMPPGTAYAATPQQHAVTNAATASRHADEAREPLGPISTSEKQGYGCLIAGGASLVLTAITGTNQVVGIFPGASTLPPAGPLGVGLAVTGTVFASTCAVGALVAPTAIRLWRYYYQGDPIVGTP